LSQDWRSVDGGQQFLPAEMRGGIRGNIIQGWKREGVADEHTLKALKQHDFPIRMKADPFGRLIYCSTGTWDNPQMRSKWANVMQWVAENNKKAGSFTEFVTNNGGLNNCSEYAAASRNTDWT
jgi:hypothetical protein